MSSQIAPLAARDTLCDRCAVSMTDSEEPALATLRLRGARILVDKVMPVGSREAHRVSEHIFAPGDGQRSRQIYGIEAVVIAVGPDIDPADIAVGNRVIIDEFAGRPIFWGDRVLPYWIIGDGEVMVAIDERGGE